MIVVRPTSAILTEEAEMGQLFGPEQGRWTSRWVVVSTLYDTAMGRVGKVQSPASQLRQGAGILTIQPLSCILGLPCAAHWSWRRVFCSPANQPKLSSKKTFPLVGKVFFVAI